MSTNALANFGMPNIQEYGQLNFEIDSTLANALNSCVDDTLLEEIISSGGMTGQKYRTQAMKCVASALMSMHGTRMQAADNVTKAIIFNTVMCAIGMLLGVTSNKKKLQSTIGNIMKERNTQNDALGFAWRIIDENFRTFVNEKGVSQDKFPSLKFCSCCPEFALMGVMILVSRKYNFTSLNTELAKPYLQWPELLKKQWVGNFYLSKSFQTEHMVWERLFWNITVTSTSNINNKDFTKGFKAKIYATTISDGFLPVLPNGSMVTTAGVGFSHASFSFLVLTMAEMIRSGLANTHPAGLGGSIMGGPRTHAMTATGNLVSMQAAPISVLNLALAGGMTRVIKGEVLAIADVPTPASLTTSINEEDKTLLSAIESIVTV
jgi:hypothetical protein